MKKAGTVTRIAGQGIAEVSETIDMNSIGATKDCQTAYEVGCTIGEYLSKFQVNVNFAPVADVFLNINTMNMGAIVNRYNSAEAAVYAIQAGVDILLMPNDFVSAYNGVIEAVHKREIDEDRINESLKRILKLKRQYR